MTITNSNDKKTILLVDDEEPLAVFLKRLLILRGYDVIVAHNGQEAVQTYRNNRDSIDLILMDVVMPIMNGVEAVNEILKFTPTLPILLMSAYAKESIEGLTHTKFIRKPMLPDDLFKSIEELFL